MAGRLHAWPDVRWLVAGCALIAAAAAAAPLDPPADDPLTTSDASGWLRTFTATGSIDPDNAFFQSLGSNGRSCNTCHRQEDAWSLTPAGVQARFEASGGTDPLFRPVDGADSPLADVSSVDARRTAYSMLLRRAVLRVGIGIPAGAEFSLDAVDDPYGFASAAQLSLFRRPLPATNLGYLSAVMWDGRESAGAFVPPMDAGVQQANLVASLRSQALHAIAGHAEGTVPPSEDDLEEIVAFETGLTTAQVRDDRAGLLNADDALGGPRILANQRYYIGINDTLGGNPTGAPFDPVAMGLFAAWDAPAVPASAAGVRQARAAVARGERVFNTRVFQITGVGGLNDALGVGAIAGTCSTCHNAPNVGNHSVTLPLDLGISAAAVRTPDLPLYTLRNIATGETVQTTDPGRALVTGRWADIGKFKGPILRGLAGRAPYFHNGAAASIEDAIDFYDTRFSIGFTARERQDLAAFLRAL
jgi:hypothetical protein